MFDFLSEYLRLIPLLVFIVPAILLAEKSSRTKIFDTQRRVKAETLTRGGLASVEIRHDSESVSVVLTDGFEFDVSLGRLHASLSELRDESAKQAAVVATVDEFMAMVAVPKLSAETLEYLYPVIAAANPLLIVSMQQLEAASRQEVAPGLASYLVLRRGVRTVYLTEADISGSGFAEAVLRDQAIANLRATLAKLEFKELSVDPWVAQIGLDGLLNVAVMLLPEVWNDLTAKHGQVAVACPEFGTLLVTEAGSAEAMEFLRQNSVDLRAKAAFPISYGIYRWQDAAWKLLP